MGVEDRKKDRAFLDNTNTGMAMTMDTTLVAFWVSKPAFEIKVVGRQVGQVVTDKKAWSKAGHDLGKVLSEWIEVLVESQGDVEERGLPLIRGIGGRVEGSGDLTYIFDISTNSLLSGVNLSQAAINTVCQPLEAFVNEAPFFASRFR